MSDEHAVGRFNTPTCPPPLADDDVAREAVVKPPPPDPEVDALDKIRDQLERKLKLNESDNECQDDEEPAEVVIEAKKKKDKEAQQERINRKVGRPLKTVDMEGLVSHWKAGGFKRIVTMVGAGISTSAGIPDFRSPGTGLYNNLKKYKLPYPTAIFEIDYFVHKPRPFFALAKELYPGNFRPTACHYFVRLLNDKGLLLRHYTQNIDTLERIAGIPDERLVEAHGTFHTNHCLDCRRAHSLEWMREQIFADKLPRCQRCGSLVKPDIVFFGENLPERFYTLPERDLGECDLLIVMGTSLEVHPFAGLVDLVNDRSVRLLINRETVGVGMSMLQGFQFGREHNDRDVLWQGDCDAGIWWLADELGMKVELEELISTETARLATDGKAEAESTTAQGKTDEPAEATPTGDGKADEPAEAKPTGDGGS